jgi:hypothetical protein
MTFTRLATSTITRQRPKKRKKSGNCRRMKRFRSHWSEGKISFLLWILMVNRIWQSFQVFKNMILFGKILTWGWLIRKKISRKRMTLKRKMIALTRNKMTLKRKKRARKRKETSPWKCKTTQRVEKINYSRNITIPRMKNQFLKW